MTKRTSSAKLLFYDITGEGAKVQIMADLGCDFGATLRVYKPERSATTLRTVDLDPLSRLQVSKHAAHMITETFVSNSSLFDVC